MAFPEMRNDSVMLMELKNRNGLLKKKRQWEKEHQDFLKLALEWMDKRKQGTQSSLEVTRPFYGKPPVGRELENEGRSVTQRPVAARPHRRDSQVGSVQQVARDPQDYQQKLHRASPQPLRRSKTLNDADFMHKRAHSCNVWQRELAENDGKHVTKRDHHHQHHHTQKHHAEHAGHKDQREQLGQSKQPRCFSNEPPIDGSSPKSGYYVLSDKFFSRVGPPYAAPPKKDKPIIMSSILPLRFTHQDFMMQR